MKYESTQFESVVSPEKSIKTECGVFGIWIPKQGLDNNLNCSTITDVIFAGSLLNQHRGEESYGLAIGNGQEVLPPFTEMGLVRSAFQKYKKEGRKMDGHVGIGHNRYSTTGSSVIENAAPFYAKCESGGVALGQNGNLVNSPELKQNLDTLGVQCIGTTDSELMVHTIANAPGDTWEEKIEYTLKSSKGSFSLGIITKDTLYAARDAFGNRPLFVAMFNRGGKTGYAISSETQAFNILGDHIRDEILPGEMLRCNEDGLERWQWTDDIFEAFCGLELAYLMRADGRFKERTQIDEIRRKLGYHLALHYPANNVDYVTYIPESAKSSAEGYAEGLSNVLGRPVFSRTSMIKNRYGTLNGSFRGFINPDNSQRSEIGLSSYSPFDWMIGASIAMVDDSIIRGNTTSGVVNTTKNRVGNFRNNGAREVHLRIPWPPVKHSCPLGTDIQTADYLIYRELNENVDEVAKHLGVDSLAFLKPSVKTTIGRN
ncbi:MAG: Amidophosphoribosyltransferase [Candidatus Levybacteria bacterium GW2011_GWA2_40_16]|nr:MAG: Amidophosphoribosyltransferase [Candidatus Levybacteria bacterium GW2011_GWA2_40_16]